MREKMWQSLRLLVAVLIFGASILWLAVPSLATAQDEEGQSGDQGGNRLVLASSDASSAPTIVLRAYAMDDVGTRLNLTPNSIIVRHDGQEVSDVEIAGDYKAGTFTIVVVDTPPGVAAQLPAVQQAIEEFSSPPEMEEPVDFVSIYQVGASEADQLLAPANFYNSIRNFFSVPLETQSGPTALVDSLGTLLDEAESLKPKDDLYVSIVVITDGTDVVSTKYSPAELGSQAAGLGIPIHTIWLENENLQTFSQEAGQEYLAGVAAESRGVAARLDQELEVQSIWDRIADFRTHQVIQYRPEQVAGGAYDVVLSLRDEPDVREETAVSVSAAAPTVAIELPPESRSLTLENLEDPVTLSFSASVSWLDGAERELTNAQMLVNGVVVQEIDAKDLDRFNVEIANFNYGSNSVQVAVEDEQGLRATSPSIVLSVIEGETQVPEEIETGGILDSQILSLLLGCFLVAGLLAVLIFLIVTIRRRGSGEGRISRRRQAVTPDPEIPDESVPAETTYTPGTATYYLEILDSVTRMSPAVEIYAVEHRIGRNPNQADIVFENDITVSRVHASIILEGSDYRIYDMGSTSGTWVNGQPVPTYGVQLMDGDEIHLGEVRMRFRFV